ncbi:MAG: sigma 54-interacting transcriptional regulator [Sandaracinaceae bacterium]
MSDEERGKELDTVDSGFTARVPSVRRVPGITIVTHPNAERVGHRAIALPLLLGEELELSRVHPEFADRDGRPRGPLETTRVSRKPVVLRALGDGVAIDPGETEGVIVGGAPLEGPVRLSGAQLERGVLVELGRRVSVLLVWMEPAGRPVAAHGMIGVSESLDEVRRGVDDGAAHDDPVLITGESGTGKELVARAIHAASARASGPFVAINMATLVPSMAPSELFGHIKGAFTGAAEDRPGLFRRAQGGTLFLDEIGDVGVEVQSMLLRALEAREVTPVGASMPRPIDVRILAATDRDLEDAMASGSFRGPLFHRLGAERIALRPLRERLEDIVPILLSFAPELELRAEHARVLLAHRWPGNARELRNIGRWLATGSESRRQPGALAERLGVDTAPVVPLEAAPSGDLTDDALVQALHEHGYAIGRTARALNVSKNYLYKRMADCPQVRRARDVTPAEIEAASDACGGDVQEMARTLRVSSRGLSLRMTELGMDR